jgi:hypothetical protein
MDGVTEASENPFLAGVFPGKGGGDAEVRQALNHCAQCGSPHFREVRQGENSP